MGGLFSSMSNASQMSEDEMRDLGAMLNRLTAESAGPVEQVSQGVQIMQNVNKWIFAYHRTMSDSRMRNSIDEIVETLYECNEKTLNVLDFITTHKAELEDCVEFSTAVGELLETDPTNVEGIKRCIVRAKKILQGSDDTLSNGKQQIRSCLQAYDDLKNEIENMIKLMQRKVWWQKCLTLVQVATVAASFVLAGAAVCGLPIVVIGSGIAGAAVAAPAASAVWRELTRTDQRIQEIRVVLKGVERQRAQVGVTYSDVEQLYRYIVQVERRIEIADIVTNSSTVDQDLIMKRGRKLIELCGEMDTKFKKMEDGIQFLRTQVVEAQRSRYYERRRN